MAKTKEIDITWNDKPEKVTIKRLTWGERNDLMEEAVNIQILGKDTIVKPSNRKMREVLMLKGIVKAPFNIDLETIRSLEPDIGDFIHAELEAFNTISPLQNTN